MPPMKHKHLCPSSCILRSKIWVFSQDNIEYFMEGEWESVELPFGGVMLPFQFMMPVSASEIIIFGGVSNNEKSAGVKLFNTESLSLDNYGDILPVGICSERTWGPVVISNSVVVLSNIQASVYPQVAVKSSVSQVVYLTGSTAFLNNIVMV